MTYNQLKPILTYFVRLEQDMFNRGYYNIALYANKQVNKIAIRMASAYWNEEGLV